jgi:hypothetical protein
MEEAAGNRSDEGENFEKDEKFPEISAENESAIMAQLNSTSTIVLTYQNSLPASISESKPLSRDDVVPDAVLSRTLSLSNVTEMEQIVPAPPHNASPLSIRNLARETSKRLRNTEAASTKSDELEEETASQQTTDLEVEADSKTIKKPRN